MRIKVLFFQGRPHWADESNSTISHWLLGTDLFPLSLTFNDTGHLGVSLFPPDRPAGAKEQGGAGFFHSTQAHSLVSLLSQGWAENSRLR